MDGQPLAIIIPVLETGMYGNKYCILVPKIVMEEIQVNNVISGFSHFHFFPKHFLISAVHITN